MIKMTFEDFKLHPKLIEVLNTLRYIEPTLIQQQAIPVILAGKEMIASAPSAAGKTGAYLFPLFNRLIPEQVKQVLVLLPTRDQVVAVNVLAKYLGDYLGISTSFVLGEANAEKEIPVLALQPRLIIATPRSILEHIQRAPRLLRNVDILVLDDTDRLFGNYQSPITRKVIGNLPSEHQSLLFYQWDETAVEVVSNA